LQAAKTIITCSINRSIKSKSVIGFPLALSIITQSAQRRPNHFCSIIRT